MFLPKGQRMLLPRPWPRFIPHIYPLALHLFCLHSLFPASHQATMSCDVAKAEACFAQLFEQLPICTPADHSGELAFRCQHFNVLDICFGDNQIRCLPTAIGTAARTAYQKLVDACLFANKEAMEEKSMAGGHHHQRIHPGLPSGLLAPPSELQFISLFGYLQTQCRPRRRSPGVEGGGGGTERGGNRRSHFRSEGSTDGAQPAGNCSATHLDEVMGQCEADMKRRQPPPFMQLERHRLLRLKLDASSKLLHFPETRPEDECLMVRSVLSDIFLIHQKFCFHTTVTRCLCERLHFDRTCGIQCTNLEAFGLPLNRELLWTDFRGRLSGAQRRGAVGQVWTILASALALLLPWLLARR